MLLHHWLTIAALCASGAVTPGPSLAVVVRNTATRGRAAGMATGLAHGLGVGLYAFAAVAGFAVLLETVPVLAAVVELLGAAFLVWMGVGALRSGGSAPEAPAASAPGTAPGSTRQGAVEGFLIAFLNPKIAVFFLAILSTVVPLEADTADRAGVAVLAMVIDAAWYVLAAAVLWGSGAASWLAHRQRRLEQATGVLLVGIGGAVLVGMVR